jgi:uncharacterized membrane protein
MTRWLFWTLLTIFTWGFWAVLSKLLADEIPSPAQSQLVSTIGIVPVVILLFLLKEHESTQFGNRRLGIWLALGSGIVSCLGSIAFFDVFSRGAKAVAATPITALYPAVTVLLAIPILKERVSWLQWVGIGLSLGAIYLLNVPDAEALVSGWLLFALVPIGLWGLCGLMQKASTDYISARGAAIWFLLAFFPVAAVLMVYDPLASAISPRTWTLAAAVGFTLAFGNFTILLAFASGGKASIISPLAGLYPIVSIPIAIVFLGEEIGTREKLGIACALVAVFLLSYQTTPKDSPDTHSGTERTT